MSGADLAACYDLGGTIRACRPEATLERVRPLLRRFGITRVARITGLDHLGIAVSVAVRPTSRLLATAQGKGVTPELADLSAIMESIETWHAENLPPGAFFGTSRELGEERSPPLPVIELGGLPTARRPLDADTALDWLWGRELLSGDAVLLPRGCFDLDTTQPKNEGAGLRFVPVTTGLASGNSYLEALLHSLYEAIERDAHARFVQLSFADREPRRIDLRSINDATNRGLVDRILAAGLIVEVFEMTSTIGVPAFYAAVVEREGGARCFVDEGMGAHLRKEIALSRALTEAVQSRLAYISGARDDIYPHVYKQERLRAEMSEHHVERAGERHFASCAQPPFTLSLDDNLRTVLTLLQGCGFGKIYALDLTRPEFGIAVSYVLCPGLRDPFLELPA